MRTSPGWNLWIGGSPNQPKDGIFPLTGVVETDWAPFTFTMNWRFTRTNHWIRFDAGEPICFFFPVKRGVLDNIKPRMEPIESESGLLDRFQSWSRGRDTFVSRVASDPPSAPADAWQKHYYRGVDMSETEQIPDHETRLRLKPFDTLAVSWPHEPPGETPTVAILPPADQRFESDIPGAPTLQHLRKREWLLETLERQRGLSPQNATIERRLGLSSDEFLERYYSANRPVILTGEMSHWPALAKWTPDYLKRVIGSKMIEFQGERNKSDHFEIHKDAHRREMPFDEFVDLAMKSETGNDAYITASNSAKNHDALSNLHSDIGFLDKFLTRDVEHPHGMMWIGPAGTLTSLHHDLTNNMIAQIVGRKRLLVLPASEVGKVYNHLHTFSEVPDLENPQLSLARFPQLEDARFIEVTLMPGEIMFMPLAWWHQVRSIDFSITITYTNFCWPNDGYKNYPSAQG